MELRELKNIEIVNSEDLPNLQTVDARVVRGGQPTENGLVILKEHGIKTVVNLREEMSAIAFEESLSKQIGLDFISIPLRPFEIPDDKALELFLEVSQNKDKQPIFVHCLHGMDRTGLMMALYRMKVSDWSYEEAINEMLEFGFHVAFTNLSNPLKKYARALGKLKED